MGRRLKRRLNFHYAIVTVLLFQNLLCFSQTTISGSVKDDTNNLYSVSIILKDSLSKSIIAYTYSDDNGNYELKTNKLGKFNLVFTSLGYESKTISVVLTEEQKEIKTDVVLKDKSMDLDEVIIKA